MKIKQFIVTFWAGWPELSNTQAANGLEHPWFSEGSKALAKAVLQHCFARAGVLESRRGAKGGFSLTKRPEDLTVAGMITSLEGPVALTECVLADSLCEHEGSCAVQQPWNVINMAVQNTLATITLADLINPGFPRSSSVLTLGALGTSNHRIIRPCTASSGSSGSSRSSAQRMVKSNRSCPRSFGEMTKLSSSVIVPTERILKRIWPA